MEGYIAEIRLFAGNFEPRSWAFCNGQTLSIAQNQALFSLIGTTYGGNGIQTFCLPNLRGMVPLGTGSGGISGTVQLGQTGGNEATVLTAANLAPHMHTATGTVKMGAKIGKGVYNNNPTGTFHALLGENVNHYGTTADGSMVTAPAAITINNVGQGLPVNNMQPYLALNYIICLYGIFPSRN